MEIGPTAHKFAQPRSKAWFEIGPTAHKFVQPRSKAWVEKARPTRRANGPAVPFWLCRLGSVITIRKLPDLRPSGFVCPDLPGLQPGLFKRLALRAVQHKRPIARRMPKMRIELTEYGNRANGP